MLQTAGDKEDFHEAEDTKHTNFNDAHADNLGDRCVPLECNQVKHKTAPRLGLGEVSASPNYNIHP